MTTTGTEHTSLVRYQQRRAEIEALPLPANLSAVLDAAAAAWPDRPAVSFFQQGVGLTFSELRLTSLALAARLRKAGVRPGDRIMVALPNLLHFPVAWLAIARLGAVMVPVNDRFTSSEYSFLIADTTPTVIFTTRSTAASVATGLNDAGHDAQLLMCADDGTLTLETGGATLDLRSERVEEQPWPLVGPDDAVGIHYTSGTTGFPKGCTLTHRTWLVSAVVSLELLPDAPRRILSDVPYFYIDAPMETVLAMLAGAEQCIADRPSLSRFTGWLADLDVDYAEVWEALGAQAVDPAAEERLRSRGRPLFASTFGLQDAARPLLEGRLNAVIREMYGMSEIGFGTVVPYEMHDAPSGTCGLAAPFRETRVVDPDSGSDVPDGDVGELWVRGLGLMTGYHRRTEVNAELLRPDGWFRTGDLMRRDAEGFHYMVGRIKDMIRRSHENIAATEVEEALRTLTGVLDVAVVAVSDPFRDEEVKAFVVTDEGSATPQRASDIVRGAGERLAAFKVPRYVEFVGSLPRTPSGKVAKGELRQRDADRSPAGWDHVDQVWRH